jgi:hypothetical protein
MKFRQLPAQLLPKSVGNELHEQRGARAHADEFADCRTRLFERMRRCRRQPDADLRAADGDNPAARSAFCAATGEPWGSPIGKVISFMQG